MKRIIAALLCVGLFVVFASGCAGAGNKVNPEDIATGDEASSLDPKDYNDDFEGLCNYFAAYGFINPKDTSVNVEMDYALVGAVAGTKFVAKRIKDTDVNGITIELYEYDTNKMNATADEVVSSVKNNGTFSILELPDVKAYLSDNGKYMMIYTDKALDESKTDSTNYGYREEVVEKFMAFHK